MDLKPGDRFSDKIRDALRDCRVVVVIMTTRSKDRQWILFEAGAAWALQREIIPALNQVNESDIVLDPLRGIHTARIESSEQQREFARTLAKKLHPE
jgi:predicted RNA-binding protein with PIN domain